ncbi:MAG: HAD hydrolase-like protein, partial [Merdibacter sp.]
MFVGLDKHADYRRYSDALSELLKGAKLIGTNADRIIATSAGFDVGNGSIVAMLEYASGQRSPKIGKPCAPILLLALEQLQLTKEDVVIVGDNLETDIALGASQGVET